MKKTIALSIMFASGILVINSCGDKFLDRQPQGAFSPSVIATPDGVERALIGAYALLDGIGTNGVTQWHGAVSNWVFGGIPSDDAYKGTDAGDQPEQTFIETYDWQTTNEHFYGKWRHLYDGVARANDVLLNLAQVKEGLSEARKKEIEAEARFLRGHYHFEAKKMWNNIPFIDDKMYNPNEPNSVKVKNDKDAWPLIEADLKFAVDNLPADGKNPKGEVGRPTKWTAMAYLAKVKLFQGFSLTGQPNAAKLGEAKTLLDQVVASGKYSLVDKFSDNFDVPTRNNKESVFEVQYSVTAAADGPGNQGDGLAFPYTGPWSCCGFYQPSFNLVNAYKTDAAGLPLLDSFNDADVYSSKGDLIYGGNLDPRLDRTAGRPGILYRDYKIHGTDFVRDLAYAGPFSPMKHVPSKPYIGVSGWQNLTANNYRLIRYSTVLLWLAECEVEVGDLNKARLLVNQIRKRAANPDDFVPKTVQGATRDAFAVTPGVPAASYAVSEYPSGNPAFASKEAARKAVRFETRLEFAMEGHRFFDLVRWGVAKPTIDTYLVKEKTKRAYLAPANFQVKNNYYPIPLQAIVNSAAGGENTLKQNEGY